MQPQIVLALGAALVGTIVLAGILMWRMAHRHRALRLEQSNHQATRAALALAMEQLQQRGIVGSAKTLNVRAGLGAIAERQTNVSARLREQQEAEGATLKAELDRKHEMHAAAVSADLRQRHEEEMAALRSAIEHDRGTLSSLQASIAMADALMEDREVVVYPRQFPKETSEELKDRLQRVRDRKAEIRKKGQVIVQFGPAVQQRLSAEERAKLKALVRLARLALEGAADALADGVKATNQERYEVRFQVIVADMNRMLKPWGFEIGKNFQAAVHEEMDLRAEYLQQIDNEREEQRAIREQMREEAAALREAEKAQKEAEAEERRTERELARARDAAARASLGEREKWQSRVQELETALAAAHSVKERAVAMAQVTRAGHVYIISNIGSFGIDVFKVGMTRRLDPDDRIAELGDASVPFPFDVHGMVRCEDAPALEAALHRRLEPFRLNLVNLRKEFFRVPFAMLEGLVSAEGGQIQLTAVAEAIQHRQSLAMRNEVRVPQHEAVPEESGAEDPDADS